MVEVQAIPSPSGERSAVIRLETDSTETPEIDLHLRMIGMRIPPYFIQVGGDLTYMGDFTLEDPHTILVVAIEPKEKTKQPILQTNLPFLKFGAPDIKEKPHVAPGTFQREYRFPVTLSIMPPSGFFTGDVKVIDPWDGNHVETILVHGETWSPLRVDPPRIILSTPGDRQTFRIKTRDENPEFRVEGENNDNGLIVEPLKRGADAHSLSFEVRCRSETNVPVGIHYLVARSTNDTLSPIVIPVMVKPENTR